MEYLKIPLPIIIYIIIPEQLPFFFSIRIHQTIEDLNSYSTILFDQMLVPYGIPHHISTSS